MKRVEIAKRLIETINQVIELAKTIPASTDVHVHNEKMEALGGRVNARFFV